MGNFGVPPVKSTEYKEIPDDIYEAFVVDVEEVANEWYNPEKDPDTKKTQLRWKIAIRDDDELKGQTLLYFTGSTIGRHPKNKLTNLVKLLDPTFDIDVAYKDKDGFIDHVVNKPLRITTESTEKKNTPGEFYAKITGVLKSKMGELSGEEIMRLTIGAVDF